MTMLELLGTPYMQLLAFLVFAFLVKVEARWRLPRLHLNLSRIWDRLAGVTIFVLGLLVLFCGSIGFCISKQPGTHANSIPEALYETFQVYAFNVPVADLQRSNFLWVAMLCATLWAALLAHEGIAFLFQNSYLKLNLLTVSDQIVICGLGRIGRTLLMDLVNVRDSGQIRTRKMIVIESDDENANLKWARENGVVVLIGDATKRENLEEAGVARASEVFLVTGSDECNIECVIELRDILLEHRKRTWYRRFLAVTGCCSRILNIDVFRLHANKNSIFRWKESPLKCFVHVMDRDLANVLRDHSNALEQEDDQMILDVEVFNALERTARRLLEDIATSTVSHRSIDQTVIEKSPMRPSSDKEVAHFLMLGFGEFGQTLALQLAELAHFENCKRLRFTIADHEIEKKAKPFAARYCRFGPDSKKGPYHDVAKKEWVFHEPADQWDSFAYRPVESARLGPNPQGIEYVCNAHFVEYSEATDDDFLIAMNKAFEQDHVKPVILVCFEDDRRNFALAERLKAKLATMDKQWPIFVWIPRQRELSQLLARRRDIQAKQQDTQAKQPDELAKQSVPGCELIPFGQCYGSVSYSEVTAGWTEWLARLIEQLWQDAGSNPTLMQFKAAISSPDKASSFAALDWIALDKITEATWQENNDEWKRASNRSAAIHAVIKAAAMGQHVDGLADKDPVPRTLDIDETLDEQLRKMEHYRWVAERLINGWKYAPGRDDNRRFRWQITSWENLDPELHGITPKLNDDGTKKDERLKDQNIVSLVRGLIESGKLRSSHSNAQAHQRKP